MEKITPIGKGLKWEPRHATRIPKDKEEALKEADTVRDDIQIFTDGSCIGGGVGAAAVLYKNGVECNILCKHLGSEEQHTVYEAEIVGAIMGAHMASRVTATEGITISLDNQAAITSSLIGKQKSGQHLVFTLQDELKSAMNRGRNTMCTLRWVLGHEGNVGNKKVNEQAKNAAGGNSSAKEELPAVIRNQIPHSKTAAKQALMKSLDIEQTETFEALRRATKMRSIDPTAPSKAFTKMTKSLPRRATALLVQLRSGHIPLSKHLHRIGKKNSPLCQTCRKEETVFHYLIECKKYERQRGRLQAELGRNARSLRTLLLNDMAIPQLLQYISEMGRFKENREDFALSREENERWRKSREKKHKRKGNQT